MAVSKKTLALRGAVVVALATLGLSRVGSAQVVIGSWEGTVTDPGAAQGSIGDGWMDWSGTGHYTSSTYGVTNGSHSLKLSGTTGWAQTLAISLHTNNYVDDFLTSGLFAIDVSWNVNDYANATDQAWSQVENLFVNSNTTGFAAGGRATTDSMRPPGDQYNGSWDPSLGNYTTTLTWDMTQFVDGDLGNGEITAVPAAANGGYIQLILASNYNTGAGLDPNVVAFYFDNARFLPRVVTSNWTGGGQDPDGNADNGNAATGLWYSSTNWSTGVPGVKDSVANLSTGAGSGAQTVVLDRAATLATLNLDNPGGWTINGGGTLTMDVTTGSAAINVLTGSHTIANPVIAADDLGIAVPSGTTLSLTDSLTATGHGVTKTGAGTLVLANVRSGALTVSGGAIKMTAKGTPNTTTGTSLVTSYTLAAGSSIDLSNNSLVVDYTGASPLSSIRGDLAAGRLKTTAVSPAGTTLGYGEASTLGVSGSFGGVAFTGDAVLVKFTYSGDTNLDGKVDIVDLGKLAGKWQQSGIWTDGDINYDGTVNIVDLGLLAGNWQKGVSSPLGETDLSTALAALGLPNVSVPEPTTLGLLGLGATGLIARRRRQTA